MEYIRILDVVGNGYVLGRIRSAIGSTYERVYEVVRGRGELRVYRRGHHVCTIDWKMRIRVEEEDETLTDIDRQMISYVHVLMEEGVKMPDMGDEGRRVLCIEEK